MMSRKVLPFLLLIIPGVIFWAFRSSGNIPDDATTKHQQLLNEIGIKLEQKHYSPKAIDDNFSKQVFDEYLSDLDPDKGFFLQSDIDNLKKFQTTIDDEIHGAPIQFYPAATAVYLKRLNEVMNIYKDLLAKPFDFSAEETVELEGDKLSYAATDDERKEMWRKRLKFMTLEKFVELQEQRAKNGGKDSSLNKTDAQFEAQARQKVLNILNRTYNRQRLIFTEDEQFNMFVNTIADLMDPHTQYFPPVEKRGFDEEMSGRFYGIGAQLKEEDGAIKIASLITGSPAWKSGKVQVNDEIVKVAQGADTAVDISGYAVTDVVKLIRGAKGTEVRITFKKADGTMEVVPIIRDEIVQDESFVRSTLITNGTKKIGYIFLPEFYADFDRSNGNRCSADVAKEILKLKNENVEGIILDLRNNGGGSLYEVVQMVGLFIKNGPVVQVKDRQGNPAILSDNEQSVLYDGPLVVMVNELSASASEIFAAAIQDYKRGLIVGSTSTYGKGTVQKNVPLGKPTDIITGQTEFGALKLTFEKFYRVNGGSTQLKGVTPDVVLPDVYEYLKFREKDNPSALGWDQIKKSDYTIFNDRINWKSIEDKAEERIKENQAFSTIKKNTDWLSKNMDRAYNLNLTKYRQEQNFIKNTVNLNDSLSRLVTPMDIQPLPADKEKYYNNSDKAKGERYQRWLKGIQTDIYINETMNIVADIAAASNLNTVKN